MRIYVKLSSPYVGRNVQSALHQIVEEAIPVVVCHADTPRVCLRLLSSNRTNKNKAKDSDVDAKGFDTSRNLLSVLVLLIPQTGMKQPERLVGAKHVHHEGASWCRGEVGEGGASTDVCSVGSPRVSSSPRSPIAEKVETTLGCMLPRVDHDMDAEHSFQ